MRLAHPAEGLFVRVSSSKAALRRALERLDPYVRPADNVNSSADDLAHLVALPVAPEVWSRLSESAGHPVETRQDRSGAKIKILTGEMGPVVVHGHTVIEFRRDHVKLTVSSDQGDDGLVTALTRSVRVVLAHRLWARGAALLHASAVVGPAGGILFIGDKGAGKTSMMLTALRDGYAFLSNDQVLMSCSGDVFGLPISAHVRTDLPWLRPGLAHQTVLPKQLTSHFGASICPCARLAGIVVLQPANVDEMLILDSPAAWQLLQAHRFDHASPQQPYWEFLHPVPQPRPFVDRLPAGVVVALVRYRPGDAHWILFEFAKLLANTIVPSINEFGNDQCPA